MSRIVTMCLISITVTAAGAGPLNYDSLRAVLPLFGQIAGTGHGTIIPGYHDRYGLDTSGCLPRTGTFASDSFICVGQLYRPDSSRGTVFLLHGYFDHIGTLTNVVSVCLRERFAVAAMDLPGHGLSSGERGAINDFAEYVRAFTTFRELCDGVVATPLVFIGHSTGCAVGLQYCREIEPQPFSQIIFCAPLVRSALYHLSLVGNSIVSPFLQTTPRWFREASHDREFLRRFRDDPLQPELFPVRWSTAYFHWFKTIVRQPRQSLPLTVIQGTGDNVVDWRFNLPWYREHIGGVSVVTLKDARHQLFNESPEYRTPCLETIRSLLVKE